MRDNGTMSRKPKAKPQTDDAEKDAEALPQQIAKAPEDLDAPLTLDEEDAYSLLCSIAESKEGEQAKPAQNSRVEFSRLAVRARGVRYLLRSFEGLSPSKAMRSAGISWGDLTICRLASPAFDRVYQFCRRAIGDRLTDKALDTIDRALDGRPIDKTAGALSRFILERLRRDDFGDPRYHHMMAAQAAGGSGGGIAYQINIIGTAAPVTAPAEAVKIGQTSAPCGRSLCGECVDIPAAPVKIGGK